MEQNKMHSSSMIWIQLDIGKTKQKIKKKPQLIFTKFDRWNEKCTEKRNGAKCLFAHRVTLTPRKIEWRCFHRTSRANVNLPDEFLLHCLGSGQVQNVYNGAHITSFEPPGKIWFMITIFFFQFMYSLIVS